MNAVKVDDARRIRLKVLNPGDYYEPEFVSANEITLRRVEPPKRRVKLTKTEAFDSDQEKQAHLYPNLGNHAPGNPRVVRLLDTNVVVYARSTKQSI